MRRAIYLLGASALVFGATTAFAQPANYSGHWVQEVLAGTRAGPPDANGGAPPPPAGGRGAAGNPQGAGTFGNEFWITQDAKMMTIKRVDTQTGDTLSNSYTLDGSESKNGPMFGGGSTVQTSSKSKWDGKKLVITSVQTSGNGNPPGNATTTIFMSGKQLRMETFRPAANGGFDTSILTFFNKKK